ncbi:MAG: glycosyltransferase [Phycisphaerales bacterium]|nr:glycosyltransferase [Phycisphaerales bacterium]
MPDFPQRGQTFANIQIEGLLALGHEVVVFAPEPDIDNMDHDIKARCAGACQVMPRLPATRLGRLLGGLKLAFSLGCRHPRVLARALAPWRYGRYALSFQTVYAAAAAVNQEPFDIVHCHFGPAGVIGAMLQDMGLLRGPLVVTFYGHDVTRYPLKRGSDVYDRLFDRAELVLALDPVMQQRLVDLGAPAERVEIHPLSADSRLFTPTADPAGIPPLRVLSIGRFVEKKGFVDGLKTIAILRQRGLDVRYQLAGDGPLDGTLRRLATDLGLDDVVEFLGYVSHEQVPALLAGAHVLLAPSVRAADGDEEGTPTVIIEAMTAGLPVVATRHAGIPFMVEEGQTALLADEHQPGDLADHLASLMDPKVLRQMGEVAREIGVERFDSRMLISRLADRYTRVGEGHGASSGDGATRKRMRIACVMPEFPVRGQTFPNTHIEGLLEQGHEVVVFAAEPDPANLDRELLARFAGRIHVIPRFPRTRLGRLLGGLKLAAAWGWRHPRVLARSLSPWRFGRYALSFQTVYAASAALGEDEFDVVHCHFGPAGVLAAMLQDMGLLRGPLVVTFHGHDVTRYPLEQGQDVYHRLFRHTSLVQALDPLMQERLVALGAPKEQVELQPACVDSRRFVVPGIVSPSPPLRILSVGRFVEKKGFEDGLEAVALLKQRGLDIRYQLIGDGPLEQPLRAKAAELGLEGTVEFLGYVPNDQVPKVLAESHVLFAPSVRAADGDEEGTPVVIIEAMIAGLPVVASRHAGIPYIVEDGVTGFLAEEHQPEVLADHLARLMDTNLAKEMGEAARRIGMQRFDLGPVLEHLVDRYGQIARSAKSGA